MDNDVQAPQLPGTPAPSILRRRFFPWVVALVACLVLFAGGYAVVRWTTSNGEAAVTPPQHGPAPTYFVDWKDPDFVLVISGQMFGYLQPCGCSDPQYGGLARRYELIHSLTKKGWHAVPLDLGDIFPKQADIPSRQNLLKYETAMKALHVMGYHAIGIGKQEMNAPLISALGEYSVNNPRPRPLAANLTGVEENGIYNPLNVRPFEVIEGKNLVPKIGVLGVVGKTVEDAIAKNDPNDPRLKFDKAAVVTALAGLAAAQTKFNVVLFQTDEKLLPGVEPEVEKCLAWCTKQNPTPLHVVIHSCDDPEPPSQPTVVGNTQLITVGHKGKYVGVLGVWKKTAGYEYKYEMVLMGPEFEPKTAAANPVAKLMEDYTKQVMNQKLMAQYLRTPHQNQVVLRGRKIETNYIGSTICANCHANAHQIWNNQKDALAHNKAFDTLVQAKNPGNRQFDGECMQCHTTGFKHDSGYNDPNISAKMKEKLLGVSCESCHGPSSAHANKPDDKEIRKMINPWAKRYNEVLPENVRRQRINTFCQDCHNIDNDVHWDFDKAWPKVEHMTPAQKN